MTKELTNDITVKCDDCHEIIQAFTSSGRTIFCTNCGSRNLDECEEE